MASNRKEKRKARLGLLTHDGTVARFGVRTQKGHEENAREWKRGKGTPRECSYADSLALGRPVASVFMGHESLI